MPNIEQGTEKQKSWRLLSLAIFFALLAGLGTMMYLKIMEHRLEKRLAPAEKEMAQVLVATRDLAVGTKVSTTTMSIRNVPAEYVNSDVITPDQFNSVDGALLNKALGHGKMLSRDYIDLNLPKDFSGTIRIGRRAVTIQVGEINSVAGLIRPGNFIDITTRIQGGAIPSTSGGDSGDVVIPVLEDVLVLATDQQSARPNEDEFKNKERTNRQQTYDTLTLEVTPEEAALLTLAEARGSLVATLRNTEDTAGINYSKIGLNDLVTHSTELLQQALNKRENRGLAGVHVDEKGRLVAKNGIAITDPNVRMNKNGLLVTKDGTVLSGRGLVVGQDGKIHSRDGKLVDTASLVAGKDGTLVDKNGTVVGSNGYSSAKGGFLVDKDGHVITHDGVVLSGVTVGKDGKVRTRDGEVLNADDLTIGEDGKVYRKAASGSGMKFNSAGKLVKADGTAVKPEDLVSVGKDGKVRAKDGKVIEGAYIDKDGKLRNKDNSLLTAEDIVKQTGLPKAAQGERVELAGVTGHHDPNFAGSVGRGITVGKPSYISNSVEYIVGGSSDGVAKTFMVRIEDEKPLNKE